MSTPQIDAARAEALAVRLFNASVQAMDILSVYVGERLGLYQALLQHGPATPNELAERAGIHHRYAREWLEQQAVTGLLSVDDPGLPEDQRRYELDPSDAEALVNPDSPFSITPLARALVSSTQVMPQLLDAYRTGGGVPWIAYGKDGIESQGDFNRPWLVAQLGTEYLPAIADVHARLRADPPALVADVACGVGWAGIAIAKAYPKVRVHGVDSDPSSIELARQNAEASGVADRVTFEARDAADLSLSGKYDAAIVVEAIHDMSRPVEALKAIRSLLSPTGSLIVADERVAESFTAPGDELERLFYGASILICLPAGMAEQPSAATGTVMRPATMQKYGTDAGFRSVERLGLEHPFLQFYQLRP